MQFKFKLQSALEQIAKDLTGEDTEVTIERTTDSTHGDFSTNYPFVLSKKLSISPKEAGERIKEKLNTLSLDGVKSVEVAGPGFVNIYLTQEILIKELNRVLDKDEVEKSSQLNDKRIMVEYGHPNTHKEMHIGHMRTLITGEALARLFEYSGAKVFRANYQGDIGPHVAKALFGINKLMESENLTLEKIESWSNEEKAHFLGRGYTLGSQEYEENKDTIDNINMQLYTNSSEIKEIYSTTRKWSLDYYNEFYSRFSTSFDKLFFESEMVQSGKKIVEENVGKVFEKANGAIIFPGEKHGLHTRVFVTQSGNPTYEGKEMGNAFAEYYTFAFDQKIHVVGSEQVGYFQVVFKALDLIDSEKFKDKQMHLAMGMVQLTDRKMSSRTGDILSVDWLLDQVKQKVEDLMKEGRIEAENKDEVVEQIVVGAVKYSVLKVGATQDVTFDIDKSVSLEGDSGPYIQYSFARTQSVLRKALVNSVNKIDNFGIRLEPEEMYLLKLLSMFDEVVIESAQKFAPNILCTYLYDLASSFNLFYQKYPIIKSDAELKVMRLALTEGVGKIIKLGLDRLGINAPVKM